MKDLSLSTPIEFTLKYNFYILRKKHFPSIDTFNSFHRITCAVLQGFPGLEKSPNSTRLKLG